MSHNRLMLRDKNDEKYKKGFDDEFSNSTKTRAKFVNHREKAFKTFGLWTLLKSGGLCQKIQV